MWAADREVPHNNDGVAINVLTKIRMFFRSLYLHAHMTSDVHQRINTYTRYGLSRRVRMSRLHRRLTHGVTSTRCLITSVPLAASATHAAKHALLGLQRVE